MAPQAPAAGGGSYRGAGQQSTIHTDTPPQELQNLIDEANQSLEESGTPSHEIMVIVLHREYTQGGSIGVTLAGGADYESKEITVGITAPACADS
jgi:hypothetical protein